MLTEIDRAMLRVAYEEAVLGYEEGGLPIGAVLARGAEILGRGHNRRVQKGSPILHAEMDCYQNAGRLSPAVYAQCTIYNDVVALLHVRRHHGALRRAAHGGRRDADHRGRRRLAALARDRGDPRRRSRLLRAPSEIHRRASEVWAEDIGNAGIHDVYHRH